MITLEQPTITPPKPPPPDNWWFDGDDPTMTRGEFFTRWLIDVMTITPSDLKTFTQEMNGWSRDLHQVSWLAARYHRTVPTLLGGATQPYADVDGWNAVSRIVAAFIEPLSEYTSGWTRSFRVVRPRVSGDAGRELRESARRAGRGVREYIVESGLVQSPEELAGFIADPVQHSTVHICVALREYTTHMHKLLDGLALKDSDAHLATRRVLATYYLDLMALYGERCGPALSVPSTPLPDEPGSGPRRAARKSAVISTDRLDGWPSVVHNLDRDIESLLIDAKIRDYARIHVGRDRDRTIRGPDEQLSWEAELAMRFLHDPHAIDGDIDGAVRVAWGTDRPARSQADNVNDAARTVTLMITSAINAARKMLGGQR